MNEENKPRPHKIAVMGLGAIGKQLVIELRSQYPDAEIVAWNRDSARGTGNAIALDQKFSADFKKKDGDVGRGMFTYTTDMKEAMDGAEMIFITGGKSRKGTQSRSDLAGSNAEFIDPIAKVAAQLSETNPDTTYIIGTNPSDLITRRFQEESNIPHNRVVGLGGALDAERLEQSIRHHLNLGYGQIQGTVVIGEHGPHMVPVLSNIGAGLDNRIT